MADLCGKMAEAITPRRPEAAPEEEVAEVKVSARKGPTSVAVGLGPYRRLCVVQDNQYRAREEREERMQRAQRKEDFRRALRARGMGLKREAAEQQRRIDSNIQTLDEAARQQGVRMRQARDRGNERCREMERLNIEHGREMIKDEMERVERKRAAVEARRLQIEREATSMRLDLKEQKETVDALNLANNRALVARVRADTAHEKIRLAKTSFVDARWDKADALREEIHDWKERRRNAELHYLAGAVQLNQDTRNEDLIEEARQTIQSEKGERASELRRKRAELKGLSRYQKQLFHDQVQQNREMMQGIKIILPEPDEDGNISKMSDEDAGYGFGTRPPLELGMFARLFGFGGHRGGSVAGGGSPRSARSHTSGGSPTPRRGGATPRSNATPRGEAVPIA